jgi:hypothetical protein
MQMVQVLDYCIFEHAYPKLKSDCKLNNNVRFRISYSQPRKVKPSMKKEEASNTCNCYAKHRM